jgi:dTDP-4-amino-4,6-dideoxygalactose transaminase
MVKPPARVQGCTPAWHLYAARVDFAGRGLERAAVMRALAKDGIGTQVHYLPVPFQPYYAQGEAADPATLYPGAAAYYEATLSLPLFVGMVPEDPARIAKSLSTILGL